MFSIMLLSLTWLLGLLNISTAVEVNSDQAPVLPKTYDYIVVGGGLSGLVVANRLTEDENGNSHCY